jgi:DNA polymerase-3 subunit beta
MVAAAKLEAETVVTLLSRMAFTAQKATLKKTLAAFNRVADKKSSLPILASLLIRTDKDGVTFAATDLNLTVVCRAPFVVNGIGGMTCKAKALVDLVGKMPDGDVTLAATERGVQLLSGSTSLTLEAGNDRDYPKVPDTETDVEYTTIDAGAFAALLKSTDYSVCRDETRFHLNGIYLEANGTTLRAVSTDGHRLTRATAPIKDLRWAFAPKATGGLIVPSKACKEIAKLLTKGECQVASKGMFLFVKQGAWTIAAKCIDAQFPPYEQVIPKDHRKLVTVAREPLIAALERAQAMCCETRGVKLSADDGQLRIQADNPDMGETSEWLPAEHVGGTVVMGFNARYLIELLEHFDGERVTMAVGNELDPIIMRDTDDVVTNSLDESPYLGVVMPMRI